MTPQRKRLSELNLNESGCVTRVDESGFDREDIARRILELGLVEGCIVKLVRKAPFGGDPLAIEIRGSVLGIRKHEAKNIWVEVQV